ncbi:MAG: isoprenyl transferase [Prevotella sp.]|nr:isoprenyl transferase [Prevotella sp.]MDD3387026.1 isoprenyl transferase [Prevotella sp.]MDD4533773.1 isoprenyl transferase [Prevotella sp.]
MTELDMTRIPKHIAIIMDGNGRWAAQRGKERSYGHQAGIEPIRKIVSECTELGVKYLTLYTFSTENWSRPIQEVDALMALVISALEEEIFQKNNVRFQAIGEIDRLPVSVQDKLNEVMANTAGNTTMTMTIALSYSSRWEITKATREIAAEVRTGVIDVDDIDEKTLDSHMVTNFMPDPDLLIRTGGEIRISNYLLWQIAYSELYFCDTYWPDFDEEEFRKAIASYQSRQRRFGKTEEQAEVETNK